MPSRITSTFGRTMLAALLTVGAGIAASAHHSFAAFDVTAEKTITGTVKKVDWTNPHIWIWVDVADGAAEQTYAFEGMSPNFLCRRGWTRTTLQVGEKITVTFRPMKDGKPGGMFMTGKLTNGTMLSMMGANTGTGQ
jgi:hypothetical protein